MQFSFFGQLFLDAFHWLKENSAVMIWKQNKGGGWRNPLNVRTRGVWNFHCPPFSQNPHVFDTPCVTISVTMCTMCAERRVSPAPWSITKSFVVRLDILFPIPFFLVGGASLEARRNQEGGGGGGAEKREKRKS